MSKEKLTFEGTVFFVTIYYAHGVKFSYLMTEVQTNVLKFNKADRCIQNLRYGDEEQAVIDHEYTCLLDIAPITFTLSNENKIRNLQKYGVSGF